MNLNNLFNQSRFSEYAAFLKSTNLSDSSIKRKLSSLSSFQKFLIKKKLISPNIEISLVKGRSPQDRGVLFNLKEKIKFPFLQGEMSRRGKGVSPFLFRYITIFALFAISVGLGFTLYRQAFVQSNKNLAYSTAADLKTAGRFLSFQGRLTDSSGNPITGEIGIIFKLYNIGTTGVGTTLYTSETGNSQTVVPDEDGSGIFSVTIGKSHGSEIPATVFSENAEVWLEITVDGQTMNPRQPIATVAYAMNAETLQGLPPDASGLKDTVLVLDSEGNINLGESSPSIISSSGTFGIEGQAVLIKASDGSGGDININSDGEGKIQLTTEASNGSLVISDTNLITGSLISGQINTINRGYDFINFQNKDGNDNLTTRFSINSYGDVDTEGNINIGGTLTLGVGASAGYYLTSDANGNASWAPISTLGVYVGNTGTTMTANLNYGVGNSGYLAGHAICNNAYAGSHLCSADEIIYSISISSSFSNFPSAEYAWIEMGAAKYAPADLPVNDCDGFTNGVPGKSLGNFWMFNNTTGGTGGCGHCANKFPLACCK